MMSSLRRPYGGIHPERAGDGRGHAEHEGRLRRSGDRFEAAGPRVVEEFRAVRRPHDGVGRSKPRAVSVNFAPVAGNGCTWTVVLPRSELLDRQPSVHPDEKTAPGGSAEFTPP